MEVQEGKVRVRVNGVFYNPRMKFCRDLDMLVFSVMDSREYLDALAASGIRGIRAAVEASKKSSFNDANRRAAELIRENLRINGIEGEVYCSEANILLRQKSFEHVDIDPFGSPAAFIDSACFSAKKYLSITATDTAALCGSATASGLRKYSSFAVKTDVHHEIGLRMLIGFAVREATKYEKALIPLISWAKEHYYRVHFRVKRSTSLSSRIYDDIGFIAFCPHCLRKKVLRMGEGAEKCGCGNKFFNIGPIWLGKTKKDDFVEEVFRRAEGKQKEFIGKILSESDVPTAYSLPRIAKIHSTSLPPTQDVIEGLKQLGYSASKTHYCGFCIKTDAEVEVIKKFIAP